MGETRHNKERERENTRQSQRRSLNQTAVLYQSSVLVFMVLSWLAAVSIPHVIYVFMLRQCEASIILCIGSGNAPDYFLQLQSKLIFSYSGFRVGVLGYWFDWHHDVSTERIGIVDNLIS